MQLKVCSVNCSYAIVVVWAYLKYNKDSNIAQISTGTGANAQLRECAPTPRLDTHFRSRSKNGAPTPRLDTHLRSRSKNGAQTPRADTQLRLLCIHVITTIVTLLKSPMQSDLAPVPSLSVAVSSLSAAVPSPSQGESPHALHQIVGESE